jgi:hypothetical protein
MKKNLTLLTGIVFLITILITGACKPPSVEPEFTTADLDDPTQQHIYLKDSSINGTTHLFMYDKKSECGVIDDHLIVVKRNHTVKWKNAKESKINEILHIRPVGDTAFFGAVPEVDTKEGDSTEIFSINRGVFKLVIPDTAKVDTLIKYEIKFIVEDDTTIIDPYLKIPDQ